MSAVVERWLVALDIDGTTMHEDGTISDAIIEQVQRLEAAGHAVMLATGRSAAAALPVLDRLSITPQYVVCSNGAITMHRDASAPMGYRREWVETFDPSDVLNSIRPHLVNARFAVEDEHGFYRYTEPIPDATIGMDSEHVDFDELLRHRATRVVVISPDHDMEDFLAVVERMGLSRVSYAIGWTAWLDIAPDGVNKATAMERVRVELGISRERVMAVGDGRNDIDMLNWAAEQGRGVAMGESPDDVLAAGNEVTATVVDDGLALVLATL
ncbi:haloacid dehalogenase [Cryobacterium roopkundense]|uniref:Haloacid dehalogenase n=1 Tax=Cryobacterium roopkundense TaxID=1001240 RepID=A0A099J1E8_9MICO|nr:HAD family hydrolase [Cryobacterium roopkundense]KGJ72244.1 haloacid dehalogenase [Cryobacterium roopkundense]MBB5643398.1 Cof subfamily protein (haloacid dehalogenase superfamily) [Cryobacterium roopkundense]